MKIGLHDHLNAMAVDVDAQRGKRQSSRLIILIIVSCLSSIFLITAIFAFVSGTLYRLYYTNYPVAQNYDVSMYLLYIKFPCSSHIRLPNFQVQFKVGDEAKSDIHHQSKGKSIRDMTKETQGTLNWLIDWAFSVA